MFAKCCTFGENPHSTSPVPVCPARLWRGTSDSPFTCRARAVAAAGVRMRARAGQHCELGREGDLLQFHRGGEQVQRWCDCDTSLNASERRHLHKIGLPRTTHSVLGRTNKCCYATVYAVPKVIIMYVLPITKSYCTLFLEYRFYATAFSLASSCSCPQYIMIYISVECRERPNTFSVSVLRPKWQIFLCFGRILATYFCRIRQFWPKSFGFSTEIDNISFQSFSRKRKMSFGRSLVASWWRGSGSRGQSTPHSDHGKKSQKLRSSFVFFSIFKKPFEVRPCTGIHTGTICHPLPRDKGKYAAPGTHYLPYGHIIGPRDALCCPSLHYAARGPKARGQHNANQGQHNLACGRIMWPVGRILCHVGGIFARSWGWGWHINIIT